MVDIIDEIPLLDEKLLELSEVPLAEFPAAFRRFVREHHRRWRALNRWHEGLDLELRVREIEARLYVR